MKTAEEARAEAVARLGACELSAFSPVILDASIEEFEAGWIFYYQSQAFVETREPAEALVGNAPLFVPRVSGPPQFISYHRPTWESVDAFLYCGNANARPRPEVDLVGWREGAQKVSATQAIRASSSLGLAAAHDVVDRCTRGEIVKVETKDVPAARTLVSQLANLGFFGKVAHEG
jgi:hypothetical protein